MIKRILVVSLSCLLLSACSALDHNDEMVKSVASASESDGAAQYEGQYKGTLTMTRNDCTKADANIEIPEELVADVVQSGKVIDVKFGEDVDVAGELDGDEAVLVFKSVGVTRLYRLGFSEDGITGTLEVSESTVSGSMDSVCGEYAIDLKPAE